MHSPTLSDQHIKERKIYVTDFYPVTLQHKNAVTFNTKYLHSKRTKKKKVFSCKIVSFPAVVFIYKLSMIYR